MKPALFLLAILCLSCGQQQVKEAVVPQRDSLIPHRKGVLALPASKADRRRFHTISDTVAIISVIDDTMKYSRQDFNDIVDNFPELTLFPPAHPDSAYHVLSPLWVDLVDSAGTTRHLSFTSEVGQDEYYVLYAWFLKQENGIREYATRRRKLLTIYNTLNAIFGGLYHGGTYYGHMYSRNEGYAEFSVYQYRHYTDLLDRGYYIDRQKKHYLAGLRQLITDEIENDGDFANDRARSEQKAELLSLVDTLGRQITDNFYLRMAQSFQSDHYWH